MSTPVPGKTVIVKNAPGDLPFPWSEKDPYKLPVSIERVQKMLMAAGERGGERGGLLGGMQSMLHAWGLHGEWWHHGIMAYRWGGVICHHAVSCK